jgi:hypothetical protein
MSIFSLESFAMSVPLRRRSRDTNVHGSGFGFAVNRAQEHANC